MLPMFPFSINNTLKLFTNNNQQESIDEDAIKERISEAVIQSLPNKRNIRFNAIIVLECDNDQKRTIVMNETINTNVNNNSNGQKMQFATAFPNNTFTAISSNDTPNQTNLLLSQQPIFPATLEGLQAILNLTSTAMNRSQMPDNTVHNSFSFVPVQTNEHSDNGVKIEKRSENHETSFSSRKRKSEKPCRIPQDSVADTNGLDLTLSGRNESNMKVEKSHHPIQNNVPIWPYPVNMECRNISTNQPLILPRIKKTIQLSGQKKTSKIFNCNQCKLQFNSLNALCKHTFSDHRAFRCTFCSANFTQRSNLQRHSLKHVGFKPFICNVCNKAYYRKDHLVRHIEVSHPGSEPKSNITVKLSSSECLEFLEKMQNDKLMEVEAATMNAMSAEDCINHFLDPVTIDTEKESSAMSDTREQSSLVDEDPGSASTEKLQISMEADSLVKDEETLCEDVAPPPPLPFL